MTALAIVLAPEPWTTDALCAQTDGDWWYPELGSPARAAKTICRACPVTAECLDYALTHHEAYGIWGGLTERQRRRLRHGRQPDQSPGLCVDCDRPLPPSAPSNRLRCDDCRREHRRRGNNESHRRRWERTA